MRTRDVLSFTAFIAVVALVLVYFGSLGVRVKPPEDRTNLSMEVPEINGLVVGSNVLLRGVPIGKVTHTGATLTSASIEFYVQDRYQIPVDSEIRLDNLSALGESYIGLFPRSTGGPVLQAGQRIETSAVTQPPSISELATSVVRVLDQLDPAALRRIIGETDAALPNPNAVLPNIARASTLLRNTVAEFQGTGRAVFDNIQVLLAKSDYVGSTLDGLNPTLKETGVFIQDLIKINSVLIHRNGAENVEDLNKLVRRIQGFLDVSGGDLKVLGEAFLPKLNAIAASLMNFDTGQILDNMLAAVPPDGAITLRVVP